MEDLKEMFDSAPNPDQFDPSHNSVVARATSAKTPEQIKSEVDALSSIYTLFEDVVKQAAQAPDIGTVEHSVGVRLAPPKSADSAQYHNAILSSIGVAMGMIVSTLQDMSTTIQSVRQDLDEILADAEGETEKWVDEEADRPDEDDTNSESIYTNDSHPCNCQKIRTPAGGDVIFNSPVYGTVVFGDNYVTSDDSSGSRKGNDGQTDEWDDIDQDKVLKELQALFSSDTDSDSGNGSRSYDIEVADHDDPPCACNDGAVDVKDSDNEDIPQTCEENTDFFGNDDVSGEYEEDSFHMLMSSPAAASLLIYRYLCSKLDRGIVVKALRLDTWKAQADIHRILVALLGSHSNMSEASIIHNALSYLYNKRQVNLERGADTLDMLIDESAEYRAVAELDVGLENTLDSGSAPTSGMAVIVRCMKMFYEDQIMRSAAHKIAPRSPKTVYLMFRDLISAIYGQTIESTERALKVVDTAAGILRIYAGMEIYSKATRPEDIPYGEKNDTINVVARWMNREILSPECVPEITRAPITAWIGLINSCLSSLIDAGYFVKFDRPMMRDLMYKMQKMYCNTLYVRDFVVVPTTSNALVDSGAAIVGGEMIYKDVINKITDMVYLVLRSAFAECPDALAQYDAESILLPLENFIFAVNPYLQDCITITTDMIHNAFKRLRDDDHIDVSPFLK